jgi:hypothetical protein
MVGSAVKHNASLLAVSSVALAALGACGTLALVVGHIVLPQALWIASPYLALGIIGYFSRKGSSTGSITLVATVLLVIGGLHAFLVEERARAVAFVPAFLWGGCAVLLLVLVARRLLVPPGKSPPPVQGEAP